jgi:hypothetical protein
MTWTRSKWRERQKKRRAVVEKIQGGIGCWNGGIGVTGGTLVPVKLHWYLLDFIWDKGQWRPTKKVDNDTFTLSVNDCHRVHTLLQQLNTYKANFTLLVWFAPSDAAMDQVQ